MCGCNVAAQPIYSCKVGGAILGVGRKKNIDFSHLHFYYGFVAVHESVVKLAL